MYQIFYQHFRQNLVTMKVDQSIKTINTWSEIPEASFASDSVWVMSYSSPSSSREKYGIVLNLTNYDRW